MTSARSDRIIHFTLHLPHSLVSRLDDMAAASSRSRAGMIRAILSEAAQVSVVRTRETTRATAIKESAVPSVANGTGNGASAVAPVAVAVAPTPDPAGNVVDGNVYLGCLECHAVEIEFPSRSFQADADYEFECPNCGFTDQLRAGQTVAEYAEEFLVDLYGADGAGAIGQHEPTLKSD